MVALSVELCDTMCSQLGDDERGIMIVFNRSHVTLRTNVEQREVVEKMLIHCVDKLDTMLSMKKRADE